LAGTDRAPRNHRQSLGSGQRCKVLAHRHGAHAEGISDRFNDDQLAGRDFAIENVVAEPLVNPILKVPLISPPVGKVNVRAVAVTVSFGLAGIDIALVYEGF
jgi:hypothetical protein